ncbi:hypothetical protein EGR_01727 [Echinococcus granulosus]|uniref:Uncharacterized protein n=1 Tax=Echinococcus granulosus TaxID=6210 RepID=W6URB9_ECHGR|nr:hypothetical protein EGR_01727 [Echinococcus granulosus]EUB63236.1 hypothetical protein EGR_01727 [Echinococcus granulosus]
MCSGPGLQDGQTVVLRRPVTCYFILLESDTLKMEVRLHLILAGLPSEEFGSSHTVQQLSLLITSIQLVFIIVNCCNVNHLEA